MLSARLDGRVVWGRVDTCVCTAESLHCSPETATTLLTGYTPTQNVVGVKKNKNIKLENEKVKWEVQGHSL